MAKLDEQIKTMAGYFAADCEADGRLSLVLEVEHFITCSDGRAANFAAVQAAMQDMQQQADAPIILDGTYMGYSGLAASVTVGPACQLCLTLAAQRDVQDMMDLYNRLYLQMGLALAAHGLRAWALGCHPTTRAEALPLVPRTRDEAMDRYFKNTGSCGTQVMRGTAATLLSIDYFDEMDFVRKMRVASLLTPFFALLCDNAPIYQGSRNAMCSVRTRIWQDVDHDRCGDVRLKSRIELRAADSMPPRYIAAYAQLVKSVFGSPAALQNVLRHYAGITTLDITTAKLAVCKDGFNALAYGKPISSELTWLLMQARSRTPSQEERALLDPFMALVMKRKTIRETENYNE